MAVCSPAYSLCGVVVSIWGIIQLAIMGFFYYLQSLALAEDLPIAEDFLDSPLVKDPILAYSQAADKAYAENAINCWIAACLYIITLIFSAHQFYLNNRNSISV